MYEGDPITRMLSTGAGAGTTQREGFLSCVSTKETVDTGQALSSAKTIFYLLDSSNKPIMHVATY
jgi:hypothetical protein